MHTHFAHPLNFVGVLNVMRVCEETCYTFTTFPGAEQRQGDEKVSAYEQKLS